VTIQAPAILPLLGIPPCKREFLTKINDVTARVQRWRRSGAWKVVGKIVKNARQKLTLNWIDLVEKMD